MEKLDVKLVEGLAFAAVQAETMDAVARDKERFLEILYGKSPEQARAQRQHLGIDWV